MFKFHFIGEITKGFNERDKTKYFSLYLPNQTWVQRDITPDFKEDDLMWCGSFTKENHILHKENVKELNEFVGDDLYGYKMSINMQSLVFSLKTTKRRFTAKLENGNILIVENN